MRCIKVPKIGHAEKQTMQKQCRSHYMRKKKRNQKTIRKAINMNKLTRLVLPVFAVNAFLSLVGFTLSIAHFGIPHVLLHPITGT